MLKMPLAEADEKFTISELAMLSWRSQEQYWKMKQKLGNRGKQKVEVRGKGKPVVERKGGKVRIQYNDSLVDSMPDQWFNEEGELDMRLMPGLEAVKYMNARSKELGLPLFPMVGGIGRGRPGPDMQVTG